MSITLETVLGTTKPLDPNAVTVNRVGNLENSENNGPLSTANFARNLWTAGESNGYNAIEAEEISRYTVINRPENLGQILLDTHVKDEQEIVSVYLMEEKERVENYNKGEWQRIKDWEKSCERLERLLAEWQERENRRIPDWEKRERNRREEYNLELAIRQEEAEKASSSYAKFVFDALESKGVRIDAIRTQYLQQGYLSDLRQGWLRKFLSRHGIQDKKVIEDIVNLTMTKDAVLKEGLREILVEQLGVVFPEVKPLELLPLYEPEPIPKPEPKPYLGPRPEISLIEAVPLQKELEAVVMSPYNRQSLESLNLTQDAWDAAGISPQEVRNKAIKDIIPLNDQHLLARVVGKSEKESGNLNLVQIISGAPKVLRPYFRRPAEIAYDAYALGGVIFRPIHDYFKEDEEGKKIIRGIGIEKQPFLERAIVEKMLNRATPLASVMFPNWHAVVVGEEEPYAARSLKDRVRQSRGSLFYSSQRWYATNVTQAELQQYRDIAAKVIPEIKAKFAENKFQVRNGDGIIKDIDDLTQIIDVVRSLVDSVPREYFELMEANQYIPLAEKVNKEIARLKGERKAPMPHVQLLYQMRLNLGAESEKRAQSLTTTLGNFFMKGMNEWSWKLPGSVVASTIFKYNLGKTVEGSAYTTKPV